MKYHLKSNKFPLTVNLLLICIVAAGCSGKQDDNVSKQKGRTIEFTREVSFYTAEDDSITTIRVAVADDENKRSQGLMDVNDLPRDRGMLFIFEEQKPLSFWMANTPLSLDIIFVNTSMEIVRIHQNTQPFSEKNFDSGKPAKYAIETNGGFCLSHDIQEGMKVKF